MSDRLFDEILSGGMGYSSPTIPVIGGTTSTIQKAKQDIARLPVSSPENPIGIEQEVVDAGLLALSGAQSGLDDSEKYIQTAASGVFSSIAGARMVSRSTGESDCGAINKVSGVVTGSTSPIITAMSSLVGAISQKVNDYLNGTIDDDAMTSALLALDGDLKGKLTQVTQLIANEKAAIDNHIKYIESSSQANALRQIWEDPCAQAVLDSVLPDRIKKLI